MTTLLKAKLPLYLIAAAFMGMLTIAQAQESVKQETSAMALQALPELLDDSADSNQIRSGGSPRMKCFVDTPAFDNFTFGFCVSAHSAFSTSAVFRVDDLPADFTIIWSDSRCNQNSSTCILPIRQYQQVTLSATVLNHGNNTFSTTSATAIYEGLF